MLHSVAATRLDSDHSDSLQIWRDLKLGCQPEVRQRDSPGFPSMMARRKEVIIQHIEYEARKHKDTKTQRHKDTKAPRKPATKRSFDAGFLGAFVALCFTRPFIDKLNSYESRQVYTRTELVCDSSRTAALGSVCGSRQ